MIVIVLGISEVRTRITHSGIFPNGKICRTNKQSMASLTISVVFVDVFVHLTNQINSYSNFSFGKKGIMVVLG